MNNEVKYDSIVPPGRARIAVGGTGFYATHWADENIREEMETIQIEVELPQALNLAVFHIEARGVYNPGYGNPPYNGGYDGYAEIVVDNIRHENATSAGEAFKEDKVHIFPNPANKAVWVKAGTGEPIQPVKIFNSDGEVILRSATNGNEHLLDIRSLPARAYWMEIVLPGRRVVRQWAKRWSPLDTGQPRAPQAGGLGPPCSEEGLEASKGNFYQNKETWADKKAAYPLITEEEERQEALKEIAGLWHHLNKDAQNILTHCRQDTLNHEPDSALHWLALVETYPADYRLARHHFFTGKFYSFDNLWPALPARYELDEAGLAEYGSLSLVFAALRPYVEGGSVLNQLPEDAINSLLYWADHCNEAGALARNVLRVNGLRQEMECGQPLPAQRPGIPTAPAASAPGTTSQGTRAYPNPARDELFLSLPESAGQGQAVFYNLQGKAVHYLPLSGGLNRLPLPSGLFKPGIYLLKPARARPLTC